MKTMVPLRKLVDAVESDTLDADTTLIDANAIAVLDEDYPINSEQSSPEDQEES